MSSSAVKSRKADDDGWNRRPKVRGDGVELPPNKRWKVAEVVHANGSTELICFLGKGGSTISGLRKNGAKVYELDNVYCEFTAKRLVFDYSNSPSTGK